MCEGSAHGPIPAETSTKENKRFPTIRVDNCPPNTPVYLHISLCTENSDEVHMHNLHGKSVFNGEYLEQLKSNDTGNLVHCIQGISILQTKNPNKNEILGCKLAQSEILNLKGMVYYKDLMTSWTPPNTEFNPLCFRNVIPNLQDYINNAGAMNAANNVVRLKFRAYVESLGPFVPLIAYSKPIFDCKVPATALLKIHRISRCSGSMSGGDEVFLLCDKIERHDIEVVFYFENKGSRELIGLGVFSPADVFRQFVIVFKTPPCTGYNLPVLDAKLCIRRKKDPNDMSPPLDFKYFSSTPLYLRREEAPMMQNNYPFPYMQPHQQQQPDYQLPSYPLHPHSSPHDFGPTSQRPSEPMDSESNFSTGPYNPVYHPSYHPNMFSSSIPVAPQNYLPPVSSEAGHLYTHNVSPGAPPGPPNYQYTPHSPYSDQSGRTPSPKKYP